MQRPRQPYRKSPAQRRRGPVPPAANGPTYAVPRRPSGQRAPNRQPLFLRYSPSTLLIFGASAVLVLFGACLILMMLVFGLMYGSGRVLPGVHAAGVNLGNMDEGEAAARLTEAWARQGIVLRDGDRVWAVSAEEIGITLDAAATARAAQAWGRTHGGISGAIESIFGGIEIRPVLSVDLDRFTSYLQEARTFVDVPAVNAGVALVNGRAAATPARAGRQLDLNAMLTRMSHDAAGELADGVLDLALIPARPAVVDSSPLVEQANALLSSSFRAEGYDPVRDEWHHWTAPPEVWAGWLTAAPDDSSPTGLALTLNREGPAAFLQANAQFADERYIEIEDAVTAMQAALARSETRAVMRVRHHTTTYTVRAGQTLSAIAEEVGIPYPYIQAENPGINIDALSAGQQLTLPSFDILLPLEPVPHKRIVISRGQQHLWAYENGQVVFDWVISTGLPSSPTAPGVFQVQSHELNAYAQQWNLYMPHFMGFYHPGPNMDLMNGFHGFPTRGGGYLLWTGDLGHPVTYGCVLLSLENAERLYNWAEEGVVVEVRSE